MTRQRVRIRRLDEQGTEPDLESMTAAERMGMVWQLTQDAWAFKGENCTEEPLQRHIVRVIRKGR